MKHTHPFDDFPQHKPKRVVKNPSADEIRANFKSYMEAIKRNG